MQKIPIHYDCDTGQDDAIALLYALGSKHIDVRSISVVGGNVDVEQCARNTLQILELAGRADIPVYIGAEKPLKRPLKMLPEVFGETGMAGAEDLPMPSVQPYKNNRPDILNGMAPNTVMVATAPLTNLALAIEQGRGFVKKVRHLVIMGGCAYPEPIHNRIGNFKVSEDNAYAEYNFAVDPEAAKIVFTAGIEKITLVGLNVTRRVLYNSKVEKSLLDCGSVCAARAAKILSAVGEEDKTDYAKIRAFPNDPVRAMHDVVAMACLEYPEIFTFENLPIRIDTKNAAGQSIVDSINPDCARVEVAVGIDNSEFYRRFIENIERLI
jgi:purine nucleosidase